MPKFLPIDALLVTLDLFVYVQRRQLLAFAAKRRLPAMYEVRGDSLQQREEEINEGKSMKINNRFLQITSVIVAVSIPLTVLMGINPGPTAAQGPDSITGTPVVATQSAVVNFGHLARMELSRLSPSGHER